MQPLVPQRADSKTHEASEFTLIMITIATSLNMHMMHTRYLHVCVIHALKRKLAGAGNCKQAAGVGRTRAESTGDGWFPKRLCVRICLVLHCQHTTHWS